MHALPQTLGSGELRANVNQAFQMAENGPVVILSKSTPKGVMISPEQWDATAHELTKLRGIVEAMEVASRKGETISLEELCLELGFDPKQQTISATAGV